MIFPSMDKLENWGSKYALVTLAAKRAKQLKAGAPYLVETDSRNPLTVALEEIAAGKITCDVADVDLVISTSLEPEVAQLLAMPLDSDEALEAAAEELAAETAASSALVDDELLEEEEAEEEDEWIAVLTDDTEEEEEEPPIVVDDEGEPVEVEAPVEDIAVVPEDEIEAKPARRRRGKAKAEEAIEPIIDEIEDSDDEESDDD